MTAYSKAAKRAQKRGRPILPAELSTREPNGRPSRRKARASELEQQIKHVAVSRRIRQFGLVDNKVETAEKQAEDPRHGYLLGRMFMDGTINAGQHEAGMKYAEDMARGFGLNGIKPPSARAMNLFASITGHSGGDSNADAARAAQARIEDLHKTLQSDPFESFHKSMTYRSIQTKRAVEHTVFQVCVVEPEEVCNWPAHMYELLRKGLNLLVNYYQIK